MNVNFLKRLENLLEDAKSDNYRHRADIISEIIDIYEAMHRVPPRYPTGSAILSWQTNVTATEKSVQEPDSV